MSDSLLLECLYSAFLISLIALALSWMGRHLFPRNRLVRSFARFFVRTAFVMPFRNIVRIGEWFIDAIRNSRPDYRRHQLFFERYPVSPLELYSVIEETFARRQIIGLDVRRVTRLEWHLLSARRTYILIRFRDAVCFISAVPVGTGLLVSWRYAAMPPRTSLVLFEIPFIGVILERLIIPRTFYRTDVYEALEQVIHGCVVEATNMLIQRGVRPLNDNERRPLLREFYY